MSLCLQLDRFVRDVVESGEFSDASQVHEAALSAMQRERAAQLELLRREIQNGLDSGAPVEIKEIKSFVDQCAEEALDDLSRKA